MKRLRWVALGLVVLAGLGVGGYLLRERLLGPPRIGGKTEAQWLEMLRSPDPAEGRAAVESLVGLGEAGQGVLLAARKDPDLRAHRRAVAGLVQMGGRVAPALVSALPTGGARAEVALNRLGEEAVPALVEGLRNPELARPAARVLGGLGPRGREAVPVLVAVVQDRMADIDLRADAAVALGRIGPDPTSAPGADPVLAALSSALEDGSVRVRRGAAQGLEELGPAAREVVPSLARGARDADREVASSCCRVLGRTGGAGAVRALVLALDSRDPVVAGEAARALARLGPAVRVHIPVPVAAPKEDELARRMMLLVEVGPAAAPGLAEALAKGDPALREGSALVLMRLGPRAAGVLPDVLKAMSGPEPSLAEVVQSIGAGPAPVGGWSALASVAGQETFRADSSLLAAQVAAFIDPRKAKEAVPILVRGLERGKWPWTVDRALAWMGPDAEAVPQMLKLATGPDVERGRWAVSTLFDIGLGPEEVKRVMAELKAALARGKNPRVPGLLALLAAAGPEAKTALPEVRAALTVRELRPLAGLALGRINPGSAGEVVEALLPDLEEEDSRRGALLALLDQGQAAREAVSALRPCLRSDPLLVLDLLEELGPSGAPLIPDLVGLLSAREPFLHQRAETLLVRLGPAAVPALTGALRSPNGQVSGAAARALGKIGPPAGKAVPALRTLLSTEEPGLRLVAAEALGGIGPAAREVVPTLRDWLAHPDVDERRQGVVALGKIAPSDPELVPHVAECLLDPDEIVRYGAARALGQAQSADGRVKAVLRAALHDASPAVRLAAGEALGRVDQEGKAEALEALLALARGPSSVLRRQAVEAVVKSDAEAARPLAGELAGDLQAEEGEGRGRLAVLLARADPGRLREALQELSADYSSFDQGTCLGALRALGELGPQAVPVLPTLRRRAPLVHDFPVRRELEAALRRIEPGSVPEGRPLIPPAPERFLAR